jgi:hypothetical protein
MGGIYKLRRCDGLRSYDIYSKFYKGWLSRSKVESGDSQTHIYKPAFIFQNKESRLNHGYVNQFGAEKQNKSWKF